MNTGSFIIQNKTNNKIINKILIKLFIKIFIYAMHNYVITNNITLFIAYSVKKPLTQDLHISEIFFSTIGMLFGKN